MNFLVVNKNCTLFCNKPIKLIKNAVYALKNICPALLFFGNNPPVLLDFEETNPLVTKLIYAGDCYYLLHLQNANVFSFNHFSCLGCAIDVSLATNLVISIDGIKMLDMPVEGISYLGYEIFDKHIVIYFEGQKKFAVIIKNKTILWADYYDEINTGSELYLLKRLNDCINHGKVGCVKAGKFSSYLVYLDNLELNLKPKFMPLTFLDLYLAGNYKYCNNLLCEDLQQSDANLLSEFLPAFDQYFPFNFYEAALIKNNTPVGIVKFEVADKITNIIIV